MRTSDVILNHDSPAESKPASRAEHLVLFVVHLFLFDAIFADRVLHARGQMRVPPRMHIPVVFLLELMSEVGSEVVNSPNETKHKTSSGDIEKLTSKSCHATGRRSFGTPFQANFRISAGPSSQQLLRLTNKWGIPMSTFSLVRFSTNLWRRLVFMDRSRISLAFAEPSGDGGLEGSLDDARDFGGRCLSE